MDSESERPQARLYDSPEIYDAAFSWDPSVEAAFYGKLLGRLVGKTRGRRIVEFGSGTGRILRILSGLRFSCLGIDVSSAMSQYAYRRGPRGSIDVVVAEMTRVPARAGTFAAAICTLSTINYLSVRDLELHLREVNRLLVENGIYIIDFLLGVPRKKKESWAINRDGISYKISWSVRKLGTREDRFRENIYVRSGSALLVRNTAVTSVIRRKTLDMTVRRAGLKVESWFRPFMKKPLDSPPTGGRVVAVLEKECIQSQIRCNEDPFLCKG